MTSSTRRFLPAALAALAIAGGLLWWRAHRESARDAGFSGRREPQDSRGASAPSGSGEGSASNVPKAQRADSPSATLAEWKSRLTGLTREQAAGAIRAELASGRDAKTGLGFKVGAGGALNEAPSLRVFLLDELARLDAAAAAEMARAILATKTSAEEWAVAMRNLARVQSDDAGRAFLEGKLRELLTHEPWQREASEGFLEAFDVAVYLRGTNLVPELAALVRQTDNRAASHAAYLALDRLTINDPALLLSRLTEEPDLMAGREVTRANYFARADVSDAAQRAVLERYLIDARRTPEELKTFAGLYPNANFMISENLLTTVSTPDRGVLVARDQAALRVVNEWLADARFAPVRGQLEPVRVRLEKFVRQAEGR